ncbi:hypothetical protein, partial [Micromonospora parva]|uniref:hypothetical protein n=1 Tax=Micromonospora parva TaxID=1464048 RepID=UPI0033D20C28
NSTDDHAKPSTGRIQPRYSTSTWLQPPPETAVRGQPDFLKAESIKRTGVLLITGAGRAGAWDGGWAHVGRPKVVVGASIGNS